MKKQVKTNSKIGGLMLLAATLILLFPTVSNASLQSRPNVTSLVNKTASEFFLLCRQMETSSGPMGLNATIEVQNDKVVETSPSNGIDVHMIKNTEYGTAAMLAASEYGDCPNSQENETNGEYLIKWEVSGGIDSTTQNQSGIMQMTVGKSEYVAGANDYQTGDTKYIKRADARYKNVYNNLGRYKSDWKWDSYLLGDATVETKNWRGSSNSAYLWTNTENSVMYRSGRGMFFYYLYHGGGSSALGSRAAVVSCVGL